MKRKPKRQHCSLDGAFLPAEGMCGKCKTRLFGLQQMAQAAAQKVAADLESKGLTVTVEDTGQKGEE